MTILSEDFTGVKMIEIDATGRLLIPKDLVVLLKLIKILC